MSRDFIELYDDDGYRYIVNMDKISFKYCPFCGEEL